MVEPKTSTGTTILLVVGTGGFTHAAPVLELGRILAHRGHRVDFATHHGQEKWVEPPSYSFLTEVHAMGPAMDAEAEAAHYRDLQLSDPRRDYRGFFRSKLAADAFWTSDLAHLKTIIATLRPDIIVADFFEDAARDIQHQLGIPLAMVWPQMPYGMAKVPYIPGMPGFQIDALSSEHASLWTRIRAELRPFRALPAILSYLKAIRRMRRAAGVEYSLPLLSKPNYLALVNSFWGLETPKELPPLIAPVGPILADDYPSLDADMESFFSAHKRVIYISLGTHVEMSSGDLAKFMGAFLSLFRQKVIDGVLWVSKPNRQRSFPLDLKMDMGARSTTIARVLHNQDPDWYFTPFAPQRAILDRPETTLFVTHGGGGSVNEGTFHGTPMLGLGFFFDQPLNCLRIQEAGIGLALDKTTFNAAEIEEKCRLIILNRQGTFAKDVQRMQSIAQVSGGKKHYAADLIEEVMYDRKYGLQPPDIPETETKQTDQVIARSRRALHMQTADVRMSAWRAQNWDLRLLGVTAVGSMIGLGYGTYYWFHRE